MTVKELIAKLAEMPADASITVRVDCPRGGNCMPAEIFTVYSIDKNFTADKNGEAVIVCDPAEGVDFEVFDSEEEESNEDVDDETPIDWAKPSDYAEPSTDDTGGGRY